MQMIHDDMYVAVFGYLTGRSRGGDVSAEQLRVIRVEAGNRYEAALRALMHVLGGRVPAKHNADDSRLDRLERAGVRWEVLEIENGQAFWWTESPDGEDADRMYGLIDVHPLAEWLDHLPLASASDQES